MKKNILFFVVILFINLLNAQDKKVSSTDTLLKEEIYKTNKTKVLNFSKKDFDQLFFEFFQKKSNPSVLMSKEEFYTYTIQIAIFSERLATLYPDQKEIASESKERWFAESYEDYLLSKETQKK
jgi:hypothetical protein